MARSLSYLRVALLIFCAAIGACFLSFLTPQQAFARSYSIRPVEIDASVAQDGTLTVIEERTFNFDGSFNGVYWDIPEGQYEGRDVVVEVISAERNRGNSWETMRAADSAEVGADGVYTVQRSSDVVRLQIFSPASDASTTFRITYKITGGVSAWADTAELYWKFMSDGWDEPSEDVICTIHLPKPAQEEIVAGENVRVWGHGPLTGEVQATDDGAVYSVAKVGTSEFAEARILFPVEWLSDMQPAPTARLEQALQEEAAWANQANRQRSRARLLTHATSALGIGGVIAALITAGASLSRSNKNKQTHFNDEYFRDVPSNDHPAVLGALYNGGNPEGKELTASIMKLSDQGALGLDLVTSVKERLLGDKIVEDYRLTRNDVIADQLSDPVDKETDEFLFSFLAMREAGLKGEIYETGYAPLDFKEIKRVAKKYPGTYQSHYQTWEHEVERQGEVRGFYDGGETSVSKALPIVVGILAMIGGIAEIFAALALGTPQTVALGIALIVLAVALWIIAARIENRSSEAREILAKMKALKKWLKDFTRLKEAVPRDVTLWNKLLVMAVVLGVSDRVIEQLRVVAPEILEDPDFASSYHWCNSHGDLSSPHKAFSAASKAAASASAAELSSSSDSSGGGGGGGFSGGGGGGFGGGGGGGAF